MSSRPAAQPMQTRIQSGRACPATSLSATYYYYFAWRRFTPAEG